MYRKDVGPHTKLVYALKEFPDAVIVTADDDTLYPRKWLQELYSAYLKNPDFIHCHRAHYMTFDDDGELNPYLKWKWLSQGIIGPDRALFPTGVGGVLYPPGSLHPDAVNDRLFQKLCPRADDVWFKFMALVNGTECLKIRPYFKEFFTIDGSQEVQNLGRQNVAKGNDDQVRAVMEYYGIKI